MLFDSVPNEMSAAYNPYLRRHVAFHSMHRENKIVMRTAPQVTGPWSEPHVVYAPAKGSDLDLIIVKSTPERFIDRIEQVLAFSNGEMAVEPMVYTEQEIASMLSKGNSFLERALAEGVIVYEQQSPGGDALAVSGQV
jgi:hypothetical protein